jgi:fatty-acyl-CoA synthase
LNLSYLAHWPRYLPRHSTIPATSLSYNVEVSATRFGAKTFLQFYGTSVSYAQFKASVDRLAGWLQQQKVAKGDRVVIDLQNCPQFAIAYYAILRADAVVVPVNPMNRTEELRHIVQDSGARLAIVGQENWCSMAGIPADVLPNILVAAYSDYLDEGSQQSVPEFIREPRRAFDDSRVTLWTDALRVDLHPTPSTAGPDDHAAIIYTSGTTGAPKGALHTHRSAMATVVSGMQWFNTHPDDVILAVLPFFHVTGMQCSMSGPLYVGATVVLLPRWNALDAARLISEYRVTSWTVISTMVVDFLSNEGVHGYDLSSLCKIGGGGAAMPAAIAEKLEDMKLSYVEGYGLTETMAPTHTNPPDRPKRQCLGIPVQDVDSMIIDPETLTELPPGGIGEIVSMGPQMFQGYWNNREATAAAFVEIGGKRYFRTGDLGRVDEDGYFFIVGRLKRMINAAGYKVWPAEVETLMHGHPAIKEVCVVAAKDPYRGETVKAVIALKPAFRDATSAEQIVAWAREHMAAYKVPRTISFVDALPRSGTGKILWRALQD